MRNYWIWSLFLMLCTPHVFVFLRCFVEVLFKKTSNPNKLEFFSVLVAETIYTVGVSLLTFLILPSFTDSISALLLLLAVSSVPNLMLPGLRSKEENNRGHRIAVDIAALILQLSALVIWPLNIALFDTKVNSHLIWAVPLSLLCTSLRWWENYIDQTAASRWKVFKNIPRLQKHIARSRTKILLFTTVWNVGITLIMMMVCVALQIEEMDPLYSVRSMNPWTAVFNFDLSWCNHFDESINQTLRTITYHDLPELELDWVWVWLVNCSSSLVCYFLARSAAKMKIQRLCYALPLAISTPLMFGLMIGGCEMWNNQPCSFATSEISGYLFFKCYQVDKLGETVVTSLWFLAPLWFLSQLWVTLHVWFPQNERLAAAERLFVLPLYDGIILEQSLLLNRRRNDAPTSQSRRLSMARDRDSRNDIAGAPASDHDEPAEDHTHLGTVVNKRDQTPMIYICATMWHEETGEQMQMLKSIFRLDMDQAERRKAKKQMKIEDPDYYEFEAHIFFDNAFAEHKIEEQKIEVIVDKTSEHGADQQEKEKKGPSKINEYVNTLLKVITPAARAIHNRDITIPPPEKILTPYGGRLIWRMPGGGKIITHLKDSDKIRSKKRWSQVMYMYYFLGYKLLADESLQSSPRRLELRKQNTFLLALDGDVDFEPRALQQLVDLMKRNPKVGAACGRIHPTGSGPMVWYQKFEYALGHWMQKSTEHVIGCVLCSPGCFSLFRGSALLDDNVMAKYTTTPSEPMHYIQYDQGEDRWLCTLLLQRGYRVEYCAASDSFTSAPEFFEEFFNQRRRWMPSTMANVYDLLKSWRHTTKVNENISLLYIIYQSVLLITSIIGPGSIFMMMVGAIDIALGGRLGFLWSTIINLIPILIFILLCYVCKTKTQVRFAQFLAAIYCLVQMLVLIGLIVQMASMGICFPTTIFFLFVAGTFIFCGILHPQEILCVLHGFTYYLAIPTMYMLLMIYAMCNLHVVSWGTREVKLTATEKAEVEAKKAQEEAKKKKKNSFLNGNSNEKEGWTCGFGDIFSFTCCPRPASTREIRAELDLIKIKVDQMLVNISKLPEITQRAIEARIGSGNATMNFDGRNLIIHTQQDHSQEDLLDDGTSGFEESISQQGKCSSEENTSQSSDSESEHETTSLDNTASVDTKDNFNWITDEILGYGPISVLEEGETHFFEKLIKKYLYPILDDDKQKEKTTEALLDLRNRISMAFLMLNAIFVVVIFVLQLNMDVLYVPWPCGDNVKIEPLGFVFMLTFGVIMVIQIIGMVIHRTSTFLHVMSTTDIHCGLDQSKEENTQNALVQSVPDSGWNQYRTGVELGDGRQWYAGNGRTTRRTTLRNTAAIFEDTPDYSD